MRPPSRTLSRVHRFPLVPLHARVLREQRLHLRAEGRRGDGLGEDAQSRAVGLRRVDDRLQRGDEIAPRRGVAELADDLRAVGIVEAEDRGLHAARRSRRGSTDAAGLPSIFVGRFMWLSTSTPVATPPSGIALAKKSGLPGMRLSG